MRILVFLHGTTIMHAAGAGCTREERVQQSRDRHPSLLDYATYTAIDNAPAKLRYWQEQGAVIVYLSSHRKPEDVAKDAAVLASCGFPDGAIVYRQHGEDYGVVAQRAQPDVLIEDDCESIGKIAEMTYP